MIIKNSYRKPENSNQEIVNYVNTFQTIEVSRKGNIHMKKRKKKSYIIKGCMKHKQKAADE